MKRAALWKIKSGKVNNKCDKKKIYEKIERNMSTMLPNIVQPQSIT